MPAQQQPSSDRVVITDPRAWQSLSHPVRIRLAVELQRRGRARATDLARAIEEPVNSVSHHLRQLAKHGFIEPDPQSGADARERWWRPRATDGYSIDLEEMRRTPDGQRAVSSVVGTMRARAHEQLELWHDLADMVNAGEMTNTEADSANVELHLDLTAKELRQFRRELRDLLDRWVEVNEKADHDDPSRSTYTYVAWGAPTAGLDRARRRRRPPSPGP